MTEVMSEQVTLTGEEFARYKGVVAASIKLTDLWLAGGKPLDNQALTLFQVLEGFEDTGEMTPEIPLPAAAPIALDAARKAVKVWAEAGPADKLYARMDELRAALAVLDKEDDDGCGPCVECGTQCESGGDGSVVCPNPDCVQHEDDCDCRERSWYGDGHDSACPVTLRRNAAETEQ